ncbi:MAG: hypothetical protein ACLVL7_10455 [Anaerotruncus massiliensis (ex Togo et al. 2019)]
MSVLRGSPRPCRGAAGLRAHRARAGKLVELWETAEVCGRPRHPYTRALLEAVPAPDPDCYQ